MMIGAAALTSVRMIVTAWHLSLTDFATYATIVATGAFLSTTVSFGTLESTVKNFPRLVGLGRETDILPTSHLIMRRLVFRALALGIVTLSLGFALEAEWLQMLGIAFFFSLNTIYTGLLASMQRASGTPSSQAYGTVLRAMGVLLAVSFAAQTGDLLKVLIAETLATLFTCRLSEWLFFRRNAEPPTSLARTPITLAQVDSGGIRLFLAYSCVAIPFYLDRLFVTYVLGKEEGGRYATLALLLTAASLLVGALAQRAGPQAIRLVQLNGNAAAATRQILQWSAIASALWLSVMGAVAIAITAQILPPELARYFDRPLLLAPVAVSGVLLTTGLIEFLLIAMDREQQMLRSAAIFASTVVITALAVAFLRLDLASFMWMLVTCRIIYLFLLLSSLPIRGYRGKGE
ncbi:hypothetical protein [Sphingopyxis sp.]|uniref:hypothetical protein n=1 Tax=Sphingopyxis sp. TaxID=1908224 RepID=UPI003F712D6A